MCRSLPHHDKMPQLRATHGTIGQRLCSMSTSACSYLLIIMVVLVLVSFQFRFSIADAFVLVELAWDNVIKGVFEAWTFGLADMSTPKSEVKCPFLWAFLFGSFLLGI